MPRIGIFISLTPAFHKYACANLYTHFAEERKKEGGWEKKGDCEGETKKERGKGRKKRTAMWLGGGFWDISKSHCECAGCLCMWVPR